MNVCICSLTLVFKAKGDWSPKKSSRGAKDWQQGRQDNVHTDRGQSVTAPICKKLSKSGEDDHGQTPQLARQSAVAGEVLGQAMNSSQ